MVVNRLSVRLYCVPCNQEVELPGVQSMHCPLCDAPAFDIRQGREMEIEAIEIEDGETGGGDLEVGTVCLGQGDEFSQLRVVEAAPPGRVRRAGGLRFEPDICRRSLGRRIARANRAGAEAEEEDEGEASDHGR